MDETKIKMSQMCKACEQLFGASCASLNRTVDIVISTILGSDHFIPFSFRKHSVNCFYYLRMYSHN
jgi:hypothetical protein